MNFTTKTNNLMEIEKIEEINSLENGKIKDYRVKLVFKNQASPDVYSIIWEEEQIDILGFWSSNAGTFHVVLPDWSMRVQDSRTASGMPLISLYNKSNTNRVTIALSDPSAPVRLMAGAVEETGRVRIQIDLFSQLSSKIKEYEVVIRVDRTERPVYKAIKSIKEWWEEFGYESASVPEHAKLPMYSTWYSFHQHTIPDEIIKECKIAKEYGMDTVIVDDGWQTDDNSRGYAYCGDWEICENKIPDMKDFVDKIHALGMKFMIWFSVPFVGIHSKNYERFKGMYLKSSKNASASILDPRFKEVRDFLTDIYVTSVEKYGWDGLKLDFIDSFALGEESSTNFEKMDTVSVEEGLQKLLSETMDKLRKINPDIMIEFRQSYVGPMIAKYGNIFRVGDCPCDPINNRLQSLNLRLTSSTTAVHSDMIMWNKDDTNESVLYQLLGVMFAVPQISIRFDSITLEHKKLLKGYLDFWRKNRDVLLNGELEVSGIDANYTMAQSTKDGCCVAVLYQGVVKKLENTAIDYVFNGTGADGLYIESRKNKKYEIYDIFGNKYVDGIVNSGVNKLNVKNGEMVKLF